MIALSCVEQWIQDKEEESQLSLAAEIFEKEEADRLPAEEQQFPDDLSATINAYIELEDAEIVWRNKEEEKKIRLEKEKADKLAAAEILLEDITTTVIATAEMETAEAVRRNKEEEEAIRLAEVIRKVQEDVELAAALQEEEEARAADQARKATAETQSADSGFLDIPMVSAEHPQEASGSEGNITIIPFLPTVLCREQFTFSPATSSVVAQFQRFMTQGAVNVERNVNMVMKSMEENKKLEAKRRIREAELMKREEERKLKEDFYDSSLATLFDICKNEEEERRKDKEERLRLEQERLAREAEEERKRQEQFQQMMNFVMQRSPASISSPLPPPPP